jgi:hypothetical protein
MVSEIAQLHSKIQRYSLEPNPDWYFEFRKVIFRLQQKENAETQNDAQLFFWENEVFTAEEIKQ